MMNKEAEIRKFMNANISNKDSEILEFCKEKSILDVGCVGQGRSFSSDNWLHNKVRLVASSIVGIDIDQSGLNELKNEGYNVMHISELTDSDKYDVVLMGDVIEHIGDVEAFVNFYKMRLVENGKMIITTPNPFSFRQVIHTFLYKKPSINHEHTCHLDPFTMLEVVARTNTKITYFRWLREQKKIIKLRDRIINLVANIMMSIRKYYSPNFLLILERND